MARYSRKSFLLFGRDVRDWIIDQISGTDTFCGPSARLYDASRIGLRHAENVEMYCIVEKLF